MDQAGPGPAAGVRREAELDQQDVRFLLWALHQVPVAGDDVARMMRLRSLFDRMLRPIDPPRHAPVPSPAADATNASPRAARRRAAREKPKS